MWIGRGRRNRVVTGLDIGTTKVCALIGEVAPEGGLTILGCGTHPSYGLRCGEVIKIQPTIDAIVHATRQAEEVAGAEISEIYVGLAGGHIRSWNNEATVGVRSPRRGIDESDRDRAIQKVREVTLAEDETLLQWVVQEFYLENGQPTSDPLGLSSTNLKVSAHMVASSVNSYNNILRCMERAGLNAPQAVLQSLASTVSVLDPNEGQLGAVLIDIGGGTTDVAISLDGAVRWTDEVARGGDLITHDIAEVLRCSLNDAEGVKKRYGCALPEMVERGRTFEVPAPGEVGKVMAYEERMLAEIIEAALEDSILTEVREIIRRSGFEDRLRAGAVVTGGAALMPGVADVVSRVLGMPCRAGGPQGVKGIFPGQGSPIYSTAVGLLQYAVDGHDPQAARPIWARRMIDWVVEHLI